MSVEIKAFSGALTPGTLGKLHAVALGKSTELPRMRVIASLPLLDVDARSNLIAIAEDKNVPIRLRKVAVSSLGRLKDRPLDVIQRHALDSDTGVAAAAVKILGRVGNADSLNTLKQVRPDPILKPRVAFAAALISHRFNLPGHELPSIKSAIYLDLPRATLSVKARATDAEEDKIIRNTLTQHSLALPTALATWDLECGKKRWALVLDKSLLSPWKPDQFAARKQYLGQLATRNHVTGTYAPGLAFLVTGMGSGRMEVGMYRSSGQLIFGGEGRIEGEIFRFSMRATDLPGASATVIEGSYGPSGLDFKISSAVNRTRPAMQPSQTKIG